MNAAVANLYPVPNGTAPSETLTVDGTPVSFTTTLDRGTKMCYITCADHDIYVTFDGTNPSSTNGHDIRAPYDRFWSWEATKKAKFLAHGGSVAHVTMSQFTY